MSLNLDLEALPMSWRSVVSKPLEERAAWLARKQTAASFLVKPVTIDGETFPHFVVLEYPADVEARHLYETMVISGVELTERGALAAAKALRSTGFPGKPVGSPNLLVRVLNHFEVFGERPIWSPFAPEPRIDVEISQPQQDLLVIDYPMQPSGGGGMTAPNTHRLRLRFAPDATFTTTEAIQRSGDAWGPERAIKLGAPSR